MLRFILFSFMSLIFLSKALANEPYCKKLSDSYSVSSPLTVKNIERYELEKIIIVRRTLPNVPAVPFGFINDRWQSFKALVKPHDKVVAYSSSETDWRDNVGTSGYAILRRGCVVKVFSPLVN